MSQRTVDIFVIGGGINGAGVARDAAGRGLKVMLAEKDDYASGTSSASSKLIHGGLRYLEHYEISLVRESLHEREVFLKAAPYLTERLRFLVPITDTQRRPAWMVHIGLKLYDLLAGKKSLSPSGRLGAKELGGLPRLRRDHLKAVLHYHDCRTDDARLTLAVLLDARMRGADIANRRRVTGIAAAENGYHVSYEQQGARHEVHARFVVNAAGPWANRVNELAPAGIPKRNLRLVRGSHIIVSMPEPAETDAYTLQNDDGRVIFTIPWLENRYLMIGTTEAPQDDAPDEAVCTDAERDYLLAAYNRYFAHPGGPLKPEHVKWRFAGVRPLVDDGHINSSKVTRDSILSQSTQGTGGYVTVYGGKLTTHRVLAEEVMDLLAKMGMAMGGGWTAGAVLPGGNMPRDALLQKAAKGPDAVPENIRRRWGLTYGDRAFKLMENVVTRPELAREIAPGILEAELRFASDTEDAYTAEDFLFRRTKLHLDLDKDQQASVEKWFKS